MAAQFVPLTSVQELDQLLAQSQDAPVLLFNHDPYCPISQHAYREVSGLPYEVRIVNVAKDTDITKAISDQTGVRHESPQMIVLHRGAACWSASHFRITCEGVVGAVQAAEA